MTDYAFIDRTLVRRDQALPAARLQVKKAAPLALKNATKFTGFLNEMVRLTRLSRSMVEDCAWEMLGSGDISLDGNFQVTLRA